MNIRKKQSNRRSRRDSGYADCLSAFGFLVLYRVRDIRIQFFVGFQLCLGCWERGDESGTVHGGAGRKVRGCLDPIGIVIIIIVLFWFFHYNHLIVIMR